MSRSTQLEPGCSMRWLRRLQGCAAAALLACAAAAHAADADLDKARQLIASGQYRAAYELLVPFEAGAASDVAFNLLLGEAALQSGHAEQAVSAFQRSLAAQADSVDAHLGLGRAYMALGDYASAKIEFQTVLRFDNLPPGLQQQVEIYAKTALEHARGERLQASGYALLGGGNYRTGPTGGGPFNEAFFSARAGGRVNYELENGAALVGTLDYRFRNYEGDRRNDSDLRWNGAVNRNFGDGNLVGGVRGRVSYRGNGNYRNDFGVYGNYSYRLDADNQLAAGLEVRQRRYPTGPLRERTRNIVEATGSWTHSLFDGKASFNLDIFGGHEFNTERADGDANFYGLSPTLDFIFTKQLSGFVFGWWQNDRYNIERLGAEGDHIVGIGLRNDNLYEAGGGLIWEFTPGWTLNPEILYIRDTSNVLAARYSSTEMWVTLRWDF